MNSARFKHLQRLIGYDNEQMTKVLHVGLPLICGARCQHRSFL